MLFFFVHDLSKSVRNYQVSYKINIIIKSLHQHVILMDSMHEIHNFLDINFHKKSRSWTENRNNTNCRSVQGRELYFLLLFYFIYFQRIHKTVSMKHITHEELFFFSVFFFNILLKLY